MSASALTPVVLLIGPTEVMLVGLLLFVILFGPRAPEFAKKVGASVGSFQQSRQQVESEIDDMKTGVTDEVQEVREDVGIDEDIEEIKAEVNEEVQNVKEDVGLEEDIEEIKEDVSEEVSDIKEDTGLSEDLEEMRSGLEEMKEDFEGPSQQNTESASAEKQPERN